MVGWGGLLQTDSIGVSGVAGVQPSIKCNLMLHGMFTCYVSDSQFALHEYPVLINDLRGYPHLWGGCLPTGIIYDKICV